MRLKSLTTTHFKKLGSQEFTFTPGMNIIAGDNAQGKTTLLQAIETALFGVRAVPGKAEHIATWGQKKWSLELHFEGKDHQQYCVTRTGNTAKLVRLSGEETELVANGTTPVGEQIEELLGLAAKDYNLFIQSKQGESTGILTFGATALNRKVEDYAGVQIIEKVQAAAQLRSTSLAASAEAKRVPEEVLKQAEADLEKAEHDLGVANAGHATAQGALEKFGEFTQPAVEDTTAAMRQEAHAADLLWAKVEAAESAVEPARVAQITATERAASVKLQSVDELVEQRTAVEAKGKDAKQALDNLRTSKQAYVTAQQNVDRCQAAHDEAEANLVQPTDPAEVEAAKKALEGAEKLSDTTRTALAESDMKVRNLKQMKDGSVCPTCKRANEDHDSAALAKELEAAEAENSALQAPAVNAARAESAARTTVRNQEQQDQKAKHLGEVYEAAKKALLAAQHSIGDLPVVDDSAIHDAEAQYETARSEYAALNARLAQVEGNNLTYRREQNALAQAQQHLDQAVEAHAALAKQFEELPEPPTDEEIAAKQQEVEAYRDAYNKWRDSHSALSIAESSARNIVHLEQQRVDTAKAACERLLAQNNLAADDEALAKRYDRLVRFLREGRQGYMQQVWTTILAVSSRLVQDSTRGQITRILNDDGEFMFEEGGVIAPSSSASGAQKSFIGTSLRIGLSRALYGSDSLMIFDEPTEACSEHNASAMAATLATSAKQVLLITHRETDQALAQKIINVGA